MKKLIIDRKRWKRYTEEDIIAGRLLSVKLYDSSRKMCCLGFYMRQICGAKVEDIYRKGTPSFCNTKLVERGPINGVKEGKFIQLNDRKVYPNSSDEVQEKRIAKEFKNLGIECEFVN